MNFQWVTSYVIVTFIAYSCPTSWPLFFLTKNTFPYAIDKDKYVLESLKNPLVRNDHVRCWTVIVYTNIEPFNTRVVPKMLLIVCFLFTHIHTDMKLPSKVFICKTGNIWGQCLAKGHSDRWRSLRSYFQCCYWWTTRCTDWATAATTTANKEHHQFSSQNMNKNIFYLCILHGNFIFNCQSRMCCLQDICYGECLVFGLIFHWCFFFWN